jgi:Ni/Fe-hydrogenase subunit HybB-like protein
VLVHDRHVKFQVLLMAYSILSAFDNKDLYKYFARTSNSNQDMASGLASILHYYQMNFVVYVSTNDAYSSDLATRFTARSAFNFVSVKCSTPIYSYDDRVLTATQ